jgi:hypothetical protein
MKRQFRVVLACTFFAFSAPSYAWFFFLPLGAIADALEADPDKATFSAQDRNYSKCAGYHLNQTLGVNNIEHHENIAQRAIEASQDKSQVEKIAKVYSSKWSKAARIDMQTNKAYGADLARSCRAIDLPVMYSEFAIWQARQDEAKQKAGEAAQRAQEELVSARKAAETAERTRQESVTKTTLQAPVESAQVIAPIAVQVDFPAEATKASRILGCAPQDLKMLGAEDNNILYDVTCSAGASMRLSCDRTGLCLKK